MCDERRVIAYLSRELSEDERARFEEHLLGCDECWAAVQQDRRGRHIAENLRELAPPGLRDRVRGAVELVRRRRGRPMRRLPVLGAAAAIAALVLVAAGLLLSSRPGEPAVVNEILRLAETKAAKTETPVPRVIDGQPLTLASYRFRGQHVVMARSAATFPMPLHAMPLGRGSGEPWIARRGEMSVLCLSRPEHVMLAGHLPPARLLDFARRMGLAP